MVDVVVTGEEGIPESSPSESQSMIYMDEAAEVPQLLLLDMMVLYEILNL